MAVGPRPLQTTGPVERLGWEEFVVVVGPRDPLAGGDGRARVPLADLADRRWILYPPAHGLSELIAAACARAGFIPRGAVQTQQVEAAARLAAVGVGVAIVPDDIVPAELQGSVRRLARPIVRELTAYTRTEWSPAARAFLGVLREQRWSRKPRDAEVIA
jgi:DNA-binding transcriptional LysR family regulator